MSKRPRLGLIIDPEFHMLGKAVCALTPPLIDALIEAFDTRIIYSQETYDRLCGEVDLLVSHDPGWAAPFVKWNRAGRFRRSMPNCPTYVLMSDPHAAKRRDRYFIEQGIDYLLGYYLHPTLHHFPWLRQDQIVHFPWAVPDDWISDEPIRTRGQDYVAIFGGSRSQAYEMRNWCRAQPGVRSFDNSGCENKQMDDRAFFHWLGGHDAVVAAGSDDPRYRLTTPKYFETAATGSLLLAQHTDDLAVLGFEHETHCLIFHQKTFNDQVRMYLNDPHNPKWIEIRTAGRELIRQRHTISVRIETLMRHAEQWPGRNARPDASPIAVAAA